MVLEYIVGIAVTVLLLNAYYVRRNLKYGHQFVGPRPYPIVGSLYVALKLNIEGQFVMLIFYHLPIGNFPQTP
jgi:hypothetical protein